MRTVTLKPGRSKPLWHGHPWVHADAIADPGAGGDDDDWVAVADVQGKVIGRGWFSPASALRVRLVHLGPDGPAEDAVVAARVGAAVALRRRLFPAGGPTDAYRLVHSEGDGLPGLVVDRYGDVLVAVFGTRPLHRRREALAATLLAATGARALVARAGGKEAEEAIPADAVGFAAGAPVTGPVGVVEDGLTLEVDVRGGQKTGHYADQRENRRLVAEVTAGQRVLDLFAGSCGFGLHALRAGAASVEAVDASGPALAAGERAAARNGLAGLVPVVGDVGERLDAHARGRTSFPVVVCDPPRFAPTRAALDRALLAYRAVHGKALARTAPGGFAALFSCSGAVDDATFADVVRAALRDVGRRATVLRVLGAGPDHPVALAAPEGRYLKGLLLRVDA